MVERLSPGFELLCEVNTLDHSSEIDPGAILHIVTPGLLPEFDLTWPPPSFKCL